MMSQEKFKEFYNYKYWREIQRNQLTISSNIVFTFCVRCVAGIGGLDNGAKRLGGSAMGWPVEVEFAFDVSDTIVYDVIEGCF